MRWCLPCRTRAESLCLVSNRRAPVHCSAPPSHTPASPSHTPAASGHTPAPTRDPAVLRPSGCCYPGTGGPQHLGHPGTDIRFCQPLRRSVWSEPLCCPASSSTEEEVGSSYVQRRYPHQQRFTGCQEYHSQGCQLGELQGASLQLRLHQLSVIAMCSSTGPHYSARRV